MRLIFYLADVNGTPSHSSEQRDTQMQPNAAGLDGSLVIALTSLKIKGGTRQLQPIRVAHRQQCCVFQGEVSRRRRARTPQT